MRLVFIQLSGTMPVLNIAFYRTIDDLGAQAQMMKNQGTWRRVLLYQENTSFLAEVADGIEEAIKVFDVSIAS